MRLRSQAPIVLSFAIGVATIAPSLALAQDDTVDPWFTKDHKALKAEAPDDAVDDTDTVSIRPKNPASAVRRLRKELDSVPNANLNRRIEMLEEITATSNPDSTDLQQLAELKQLRASVVRAVEQAANAGHNLKRSLASLAPYAPYFKGDSELLVTLLNSKFTDHLYQQASLLARQNDTPKLEELKEDIAQAGLDTILGRQIKTTVESTTADQIANHWRQVSEGANLLPAESYLIGRLLGQVHSKLGLAVELPDGADPQLSNNIARALESQLGSDFEVSTRDRRTSRAELHLKINAGAIQTSNTSKVKMVPSTIQGGVVEEPNPDFLALVERYEKAAAAYQTALNSYEGLYRQYLDQLDDTEYQSAQDGLKRAQVKLENTPPPTGPGPSPEYDAAVVQVRYAESLANSVTAPMAIEPQKPYPHHLKILDELYLVPSTLVTSEESTPYEYEQSTLDYNFETQARLELESPFNPNVAASGVVDLDQSRTWTKNSGVNPRDPVASKGTYSEDEYASALNLFGLEFAARCMSELKSLLAEAARDAKSNKSDSLNQAMVVLAIDVATNKNNVQLDPEELERLSSAAEQEALTPTQFRALCLELLLAKTDYKQFADKRQIETLL